MSEKSSTREEIVSAVAVELQEAIVALAGPRGTYDNRESMLARAARRAGISYRQAKTLFYCECNDPKSSLTDKVRAAKAKQIEDEARHEYQTLLSRSATLQVALGISDEDFHRDQVDAHRRMAGEIYRALGREVKL
jgi:hypothetical protein